MSNAFRMLLQNIRQPLQVVDVCAAEPTSNPWKPLGEKVCVTSLRPGECDGAGLTLERQGRRREVLSAALWQDDSGVDLTLTTDLARSSPRPAHESAWRRFPACAALRPLSRIRLPSVSLDSLLASRHLRRIHALRLDLPGSQLETLRGARQTLESCLVVCLTAELNPIYEGQSLFGDTDRALRDLGFVLWRIAALEHLTEGRMGGDDCSLEVSAVPGPVVRVATPKGQAFRAKAIYVKAVLTPASPAVPSSSDAVAAAALVSLWNYWDLAANILRKGGETMLLGEILNGVDMSYESRLPADIPAGHFKSNSVPVQNNLITTDFSHDDGHFIFGPYVRLPYGEFVVSFHFAAQGLRGAGLASELRFDVAQAPFILASVRLCGHEGERQLRKGGVEIGFFNGADQGFCEFRIFKTGAPFEGRLEFFGVSLREA